MLKLHRFIFLFSGICSCLCSQVNGQEFDNEFPDYQPIEQDPHIIERHGAFDNLLESLSQQPVLSELDGLKVFDERISQIEENRERIVTWQGEARSSFWVRRRADSLQQVVYRFEVDKSVDAEKTISEVMAIDQQGKPVVFSKLFCMRVANDIYEMGPWTNLEKGPRKLIIRQGGFSSAFDSGNFSPWCYLGWDHRPFAERMNASLQNVKLGHATLKVRQTERYVRVDLHTINQKGLESWVFDLTQGGNLCRSMIQSPEETAWLQAEFECIDGTWVPKKHHFVMTHRIENKKNSDRSHLVVFDNQINSDLPKDAFELSGLELGDLFEVWDRRTGEKFEYRKPSSDKPKNSGHPQDEFPRPSVEIPQKRSEQDYATKPATNRVSTAEVASERDFRRQLGVVILFLGITCIAYTITFRLRNVFR